AAAQRPRCDGHPRRHGARSSVHGHGYGQRWHSPHRPGRGISCRRTRASHRRGRSRWSRSRHRGHRGARLARERPASRRPGRTRRPGRDLGPSHRLPPQHRAVQGDRPARQPQQSGAHARGTGSHRPPHRTGPQPDHAPLRHHRTRRGLRHPVRSQPASGQDPHRHAEEDRMITTDLDRLPTDVNVAVIGSGAAGLTAATRAADAHDRVVVLEKAAQLGGTTAAGGGVIWAPANPLGAAAGFADSREAALDYVTAATEGALTEAEAQWYVDNASAAVDYLTRETRVSLTPLARPDYRLEFPGATQGGRSLDNAAFDVGAVPGLAEVLRPSSYFPLLTMAERDDRNGAAADPELLETRAEKGVRTMGGALAASLLMSAIDRGVSIAVDAAVGCLDRAEEGRWRLELRDGTTILADSVVIASGGFEWNPRLQASFLPHRITPISAPSNEGDGLELGLRLGGAVADMTTFWGVPVITAPDQIYDGRQSGRMGNVEMTLPGSITVGADGKRFVNEALNYHDASRVFGATDAARLAPKGDPA